MEPDLDRLRRELDEGRAALRARHDSGAGGKEIVRATSELVDRVVIARFHAVAPERGFALVALGGYGRRELSPRSDVDLLLLPGDVPAARARRVAEGLFTPLWDLGLEVGAATRTPAECEAFAAEDHTARTALLDLRFLAGDRGVFEDLEARLQQDLAGTRADELVAAKVEETHRRRERFGGSVHLLEPDVKQSPGALRDLQSALWIVRLRTRAAGLSALLVRGILPPREYDRLFRARDFLWRVRNSLHYLAGRKEDRLTFDRQEQVAAALGYRDSPEGLAVEAFMRDYYLEAETIRRIADDLVERGTERPSTGAPARPVAPGLKLWNGRLTLEGRESLAADPSLFVRLFTVAEELDVSIYPWARDVVREEAARIDDRLRSDPRVTSALRTALGRATRADWLRQLHREGVLGALLPEFGRVTAKHQHDLYHVYTVDTHSLLAVQRLGRLRAGELLEEEGHLSHVAREIARPLPLALGVLFHDAGKGLGGHHAERGAELVRRVCARLGVPPHDAADAEFLVREHLSMSHVSQHRDLSDPGLIDDFAGQVGTRARLDMLYVLTYVDIASVGPGTWTNWKGRLLRELYERTAAALDGAPAEIEGSAHREALLARGIAPSRADAFLARMPRRYFAFAEPLDAPRALRALELLRRRSLATAVRDDPDHGLTLATVATRDRPGLLAAIAGVFAAHRIDILRADVFSTADGAALDFFEVRGPHGGAVERGRWRAARRDLARVIAGEAEPGRLVARTLRPSPLPPRPMPAVATRIRLDDRSSRHFTVVDVAARDRPGLLWAVTSALHGAGLSIAVARIATEGHRAVDAFYVVEADGGKVGAGRAPEIERRVVDAVAALP
jgi:[protein-PII] uridylyltransferase